MKTSALAGEVFEFESIGEVDLKGRGATTAFEMRAAPDALERPDEATTG